MNLRLIDWIWHVRGTVPLPAGQSGETVLGTLDPLFRERGTSHERAVDTLTFRKKDQPAQDRMATFDAGILRVDREAGQPVLRYDLTSKTLLFCFLLPLLFLAFAQSAIWLNKAFPPTTEKSEKADAVKPLNPIDQALGAPAPEKPKKGKDEAESKGLSPTPGYVFAAMFAVLYCIGRVLEARSVKRLFERQLVGA